MSIEILGTEIEKLTLKPTITGRENIPTGGEGLYRITTEQVRDYILAHFAKDSINLGNVDNTSDENKPLSKAVRDALQNVIVKGRDPLVTSVNTFTGDVVLTAEHLGLGNVNNTADLDKPLSKADIAALFLKLDKATFNEFEDIFQRFHDKVESKLSDLDAITKTTFSLATSNEERIFQLEKDLEELRDYLDAEIHRVHHSLSNTQVDLILQLISDTFDNNLYHSLYFESVIESLKTYSDTKLDLVYLEIAHLKEVDQQLDDKIKQLGSNINSAITEVRNELSDLNIDIDQQYVRLNNLIEEAKDYIDDQIATVPVMIAKFKTETTKMLKDLKDEVAGIITSLDNKVNNVSSSIDDKIRENNSGYINDLYNSAEKNAQDLIQKTEDSFTQSLNELDNQVNAFKNESKSIIDTITAKAAEREAELKGLIETQISYLDIVVKDRLKDTEKLIDDLNLSVEQSIRDTNQTLANTKAQLDAESAAIKAEIAQERIDRDNAIKVAVDAAIADIQHQLENIDIPAIHELSQKIDDLNLKIEDGAAFLSDEVIAYINSEITKLDTKLQTDLQNLTNNTTLEQIDRLGRITSLEDGLTQEKLNRKDGDDNLLANIENYKVSNDQALANVQTGIQVAVDEAVSTSSKWTEIDNRFTTLETTTGELSDSVTSVTEKVNTIAQENESIVNTLDALTTTVNTNDSTVKGLIAEEASSRTTDVETINRRINTMQSDYDSLSGTGKNLLLKSNVELKRLAQTDKLGEYENGDSTTGSTLVDYTLIFSLTKKPDINALAISLDNNTPISFEEKVTADAYKNIVHTIKFKALPTFDKVIFKETPISSTEYSVIHWAVLTKGNAIPVTDWIESPFDTESERVKTNAAITQLEQTSASANEALSLRINQNKTSIENADRKIDAEITTVNQTITTLESNTSTRLDRIRSDYQTADSTLNAAILQETTARTDENKALVDRIEAIRSSFSSGTNLVPFIYTDPIDVLSLTTSNANLVTVSVLPENLSKFFYTHYYWNLNPIISNTECFVQYRSGAEWNIQLQKSKKHIISVYLKHNSATNVSVTLRLNTESGQVLEGIVSVIPSSSFERYFVIIETPAEDTLGYLSIVFSGQPSTTILSISRLMVEQKDIEPSVWTSGTIASTSTYVNKISTLNNNQVALAERFENLSSEFQTSDSTLRGLIVQESEIRSTADESLSRKVDSVQASFDNSVFGGQNFWEFNSNGIVDIGTGSIESINNNVQHQKVTISSLSPTQSFKSRWTNLKVQQSPILDLAVPVSLSFDVFTSKLSKIRIDCDTWEANSGSSKLLDVVPGKWNRVSFDNIVSATLSGSDNYVGRLLLSINASEVETPVNDILGSFIEIRNIQLQQGTKSTGFVPPIVTLQNELIKTNAAITTESDTRASQNLAIASRVDGVTADIVNSENRSNAKILTEEQARVEGDRVLTERIEHLESTTDQISVGGANLIPFSYMFKKGTSSNPGVVVDINSDNKLTIQATDSQALSVTISNYMHDTSTTDYALTNVSNTGIVTVIMSYWVKRNNSSQPFIKHPEARLNSSTPFVEPFFVRGSPLYPNAYQLSYKFTSTTEVGFTSIAPALRTRGSELASALTIDRWKLELGQLATDWTDFKESTIEIEKRTQASISTIQKTISDNNEAMTSEINKATSLISDLPNQGINLLPYLTTVPKDVSFFKKTGLVDFVFNNTVAFAPYNGINVTTKDANLSTIILNSSSNPFNIVLKQGRYLFSIDASSTTSGHTISVDLAPVRGTSGSIIKGASVALTTTLKSYSFLFTIPVDGMYDVVINVNNPKVINRLMSFTKPILEQQVGTNLKASPFKEGLVDSAYSLLPISASESNIISQLETTTTEGKATAKLVTDLRAEVQAEDTKVQGQIVTISQSISTLEGNTSTQINQMTSKFEKDMLRSSENLVSLKNISATSNGKVTVSTDRSFFTFSKVSSDSYFNIPVDFSQLQVGTRLTFSFNARSNYVLKDILLSQSSLLKVVKVLVGDVEQTSITNSKIIFNSSLAVNKFHSITILFEVLTLNSGVVQLGTSFNSTDKTFNTEIQYSMLSIGSKGIGWRLSAEDSEIYKLYTDAQITQYSQTVADEFRSVAETQNSMQTAMAQDRIKAETDIATVNKTISDMDEAYAQQFTTINTKFTNYQGSGNNLLNYEISVLDKVGMFANSIGLELSRIEQVNTDYNNMVFKTIGTRNSFTLRLDLGENYSTLSDVLFSLYLSNKVVPLKVSINTVESTVSASSVDNRLKGKPTNNPYIELVITTVDGSNIQPGVDIFSISRLMVEQATNGTPSTWTAGNKGIGSVVESSALELRESISNTQETLNRRIDSMESSFNGRIAGGGNLWTVTDKSVNITTITGNALVTVVDSTIEYFNIKSNVAQTNLAVKIAKINVVPNQQIVPETSYSLSFKIKSTANTTVKIDVINNTSVGYQSEIISLTPNTKLVNVSMKFTGTTVDETSIKFTFPSIALNNTVSISEVMFQEGNTTQFTKSVPFIEKAVSSTNANIEDHKRTYATDKEASATRLNQMSAEYKSSGGSILIDNTTSNPSSWFSSGKANLKDNFVTSIDAPSGYSMFTKTTSVADNNLNDVYNLTTVPSGKAYRATIWIKCMPGSLGKCYLITGTRNSTDPSAPIVRQQFIDVTPVADGNWYNVGGVFSPSPINTPQKYFGFRLNVDGASTGGQVFAQGYTVSSVISDVDIDGSVATKANVDELTTVVTNANTASAEKITKLQSDLSNVDTKAGTAITNAAAAQQTANTAVNSNSSTASNLSTLSSKFNVSAIASSNLLINSNVELLYRADKSYPHGIYTLGEPWEIGAKYTLLWCATHTRATGDTTSSLAVYAGGGTQTVQSVTSVSSKVNTITFIKSSSGVSQQLNFYLLSNPAVGVATVATIHWAVLVKGDFLTTNKWIPSSYDYISAKNETNASITTLNRTLTDADSALSSRIDTLSSTVSNNDTTVSGRINDVVSSVSTLDANTTTKLSTLESSISTIEDNVAQKFDASLINDYYTKTKADEAIAGKLESYKASLKVGGSNLLLNSGGERSVTNNSSGERFISNYNIEGGSLKPSTEYTLSIDIKASEGNTRTIDLFFVHALNTQHKSKTNIVSTTAWVRYTFTFTTGDNADQRGYIRIDLNQTSTSPIPTDTLYTRLAQLEEGNVATAWTTNSSEVQNAIDANASAINTTNTEVLRVNGLVTTQSSSINRLQSDLSTLDTTVTGKIDDVATSVTTLEGNTNSKISSLKSSMELTATTLMLASTMNLENDLTLTIGSLAEVTRVVDKTATGGNVLSFGDNSGNDNFWGRTTQLLPIDANRVYRLRARLRIVSGAGTLYLGVGCLDSDKSKYISTSGSTVNDLGSSNYVLSAAKPALGTWMTYEYFFQGKSTGAASGAGTIIDPRKFQVNAAHAAPMFIFNYSSAAGTVEVDYITFELADELKETRATSSALSTLTTKVNTVDGNLVTLNNSFTELQGRTAAVEGDLSKKFDSSSISDYYTKNEADSVAAGAVNTFEAKLKIGATNLAKYHSSETDRPSVSVNTNTFYQEYPTGVKLQAGISYVFSITITKIEGYETVPLNVHLGVSTTETGPYVRDLGFNVNGIVSGERVVIKFTPTTAQLVHATLGDTPYLSFRIRNEKVACIWTFRQMQVEEGSIVTSWRPSTVSIQEQLDAKTVAINATDTEVRRVNGLVTTQGSSISSLTSSFEAARDSDSLVADYLMKTPSQWISHYNYDLSSYFTTVTNGKISNTVFRKPSSVAGCWNYSVQSLPNTRKYKLSMWVRCDANSNGACNFTARWITPTSPNFNNTNYINVATTSVVPKTNTWTYLSTIADLTSQAYTQLQFGFAIGHSTAGGIWEMQGFKVEAVLNDSDIDSAKIATKASVDSVQTTLANADLALSQRIDTLSATVGGKADASILSTYITKADSTTAIASKVDEFKSSLVIGGENLLNNSDFKGSFGSSNWASNGGGLTTVTDSVYGKVAQTALPGGIVHSWLKLDNGVSYVYSALIKMASSVTMTTGYPLHYHSGLNNINQNKITVEEKSHITIPAGVWTRVWIKFKLTGDADSFRPFIYYAGATDTIQIAWTKLERGTVPTDWSENSTKIREHTESIDGVKSLKTISIDNNGVVAGYGLISELVDGSVTSAFAINADQFYIGNPSSGKKPFIVLTGPGTVNGVSVPAGTYIDTAYIGDATISSAKIGKLDANKITVGSSSTYESGYNPSTNLQEAKDYVDIDSYASNYKVFHNVAGVHNRIAAQPGVLVIKTPITMSAYMTQVDISGYNYYSTSETLFNISVGFYAYSGTSFINTRAKYSGINLEYIKLALDANNKVVILIKKIGNWAHPMIAVDQVKIGYSSVSDSMKDNWDINFETDVSAYTVNLSLGLDQSETVAGSTAKVQVVANQISDIAADNKLTAVEKKSIKLVWDDIQKEYSELSARATSVGLAYDTLSSSYNALNTYLTPLLVNTNITSDIVRTTFENTFTSYRTAASELEKLITTWTINTAVDKVEVGGNNLIKNSNFANGLEFWTVSTATISVETDDRFGKIAKVISTADTQGIRDSGYNGEVTTLRIVAGQDYTLSGWVKASAAMSIFASFDGSFNSNALNISATTSWQYFSLTGKATTNFITRFYGMGTFYVANIKLEEGNKATAWTAAPEDVNSLINSKAKTFLVTPTIPYSSGDIWKDGATTKVCIITRTTGSYIASDWNLVGDVTANNTSANTAKVGNATAASVESSLSTVNDMSADNKLTPLEKQQAKTIWDSIANSHSNLLAQATTAGVSSTAYTTAYNTLDTYLSPLFSSMTTTTTIVRATFNTNFAALYMQKSALEKAINDASFTIGGENLLDNTSFIANFSGWSSNGGTNTIVSQTVGNGATTCLSIVATGANQGIYRGLNNRYTATSATVTVSFWAKASAAGLTLGVASENHTGTSTVTLTTAWQYYSLTLTKTTANPNIVIYSGAAGTFYVSQLKYEKGAVATAWSPSTYELDASISSASSAASDAAILAGNKGEVIYGATAPTVAQRLSQNLWIDTTGNANTPKRWNGTAWVSVTDKAAIDAKAAADNAVALASAADNQLSLWKYPNTTQIDGGKIYTNSITANQIQVDNLSAISANLGTFTTTNAKGTMKIGGTEISVKDINGVERIYIGL